MSADRTLIKEVKAANGDGSREAMFTFYDEVRAVCRECSTPDVRSEFGNVLRRHSRAAVAVCVAATIDSRADRLDPKSVRWAREVLSAWTNHPCSQTWKTSICIADNLHPTRIEEYAGRFIRATTE